MDCQWVEDHLEAIFSDKLAAEENRRARQHIESCDACRNEVQALIAIDPMIKKYFRAQLLEATRAGDAPARGVRGFRWTLHAGAVALVAVVLVVLLRTPHTDRVEPLVPVQTAASPTVSVDAPSVNKDEAAVQNERTKPSPDQIAKPETNRRSVVSPVIPGTNAPAFLVSDPAGYAHSIQDYRGFKTLIGVWSPEMPDSIAALERLYKTFGSDPTIRFVGVSPQRAKKPAKTTFPIFSNQGSRLMGAKLGEFVLLDESGTVTLHGLLNEDFETLSKTLRAK
jgi:Putative zinc-finger